jgi:hypothetical protein
MIVQSYYCRISKEIHQQPGDVGRLPNRRRRSRAATGGAHKAVRARDPGRRAPGSPHQRYHLRDAARERYSHRHNQDAGIIAGCIRIVGDGVARCGASFLGPLLLPGMSAIPEKMFLAEQKAGYAQLRIENAKRNMATLEAKMEELAECSDVLVAAISEFGDLLASTAKGEYVDTQREKNESVLEAVVGFSGAMEAVASLEGACCTSSSSR